MWRPNFVTLQRLDEVADIINRPHEDYPRRVGKTEYAISYIVTYIRQHAMVLESHIRGTHAMVMDDIDSAGNYRQFNVEIRGVPLKVPFYEVSPRMQTITPLSCYYRQDSYHIGSVDDIKRWYCLFQEIHPFEDGNGRVGGIILAAISKAIADTYIINYEIS